jgi:hypothetical protein
MVSADLFDVGYIATNLVNKLMITMRYELPYWSVGVTVRMHYMALFLNALLNTTWLT